MVCRWHQAKASKWKSTSCKNSRVGKLIHACGQIDTFGFKCKKEASLVSFAPLIAFAITILKLLDRVKPSEEMVWLAVSLLACALKQLVLLVVNINFFFLL